MADVEASSARITGWGTALPEKIVTNVHLATTLDTSDEWITAPTGIRAQRVGGPTTGLGIEAGGSAQARAAVPDNALHALPPFTSPPHVSIPPPAPVTHTHTGVS